MLKSIFEKIFPPALNIKFDRNIHVNYFINEEYHHEVKKNGYVVIKNIVTEKDLTFLQDVFNNLELFPAYKIDDKFQNSGRYRSADIRNFVMKNIEIFSKEFLPGIFNTSIYDEHTTGAFQIKPPSKVSELNPHQDAPVIDETKFNGLFVWIPLTDITEKNGAIYVLPKSHLIGNYQRSLNVPWIFEPYTKLLWKYMQPIYLEKGDILCWDSALIHASSSNLSNENRIAITTTILPKNFKMIDFFKDKNTPADSVERYEVERSFWENEDIMKRPPCPPNKFIGLEKLVFSQKIKKSDLSKLFKKN